MKDWDYSNMTHEAREHGGPQKYIADIREHERELATKNANRFWLSIVVPMATVLVSLGAKKGYDLYYKYIKKPKVTDEDAKNAETAIKQEFEKHTIDDQEQTEDINSENHN